MDELSMKLGLLLEAAQVQQSAAESVAARLRDHIDGLDAVVRDEIRRTVVEELGLVVTEARRAAAALRRIGRSGLLRCALWATAVMALCAYAPLAAMRWSMPSPAELEGLEARRARLAAGIALLERRGGDLELKQCGRSGRVCVRIDRSAPAYGDNSDYYVVAGR